MRLNRAMTSTTGFVHLVRQRVWLLQNNAFYDYIANGVPPQYIVVVMDNAPADSQAEAPVRGGRVLRLAPYNAMVIHSTDKSRIIFQT